MWCSGCFLCEDIKGKCRETVFSAQCTLRKNIENRYGDVGRHGKSSKNIASSVLSI